MNSRAATHDDILALISGFTIKQRIYLIKHLAQLVHDINENAEDEAESFSFLKPTDSVRKYQSNILNNALAEMKDISSLINKIQNS